MANGDFLRSVLEGRGAYGGMPSLPSMERVRRRAGLPTDVLLGGRLEEMEPKLSLREKYRASEFSERLSEAISEEMAIDQLMEGRFQDALDVYTAGLKFKKASPRASGIQGRALEFLGLPQEGLIGEVVKAATDPWMLIGALLCIKFPIPVRERIKNYVSSSREYLEGFGGLFSKMITPLWEALRTRDGKMTALGKWATGFSISHGETVMNMLKPLAEAYESLDKRFAQKSIALASLLAQRNLLDAELKSVGKAIGAKDIGLNFELMGRLAAGGGTEEQRIVWRGARELLKAWDSIRSEGRMILSRVGEDEYGVLKSLMQRGIVDLKGKVPTSEYFMRIAVRNPQKMIEEVKELVSQGKTLEALEIINPYLTVKGYYKKRMPSSLRMLKRVMMARVENGSLPDPSHLELVSEFLKEGTVDAVRRFADSALHDVYLYSLDMMKASQVYADSMGRLKAWYPDRFGARVMDELKHIKSPELRSSLERLLLPAMRGEKDEIEFMRMFHRENRAMNFVRMMNDPSHPLGQLLSGKTGEEVKKYLTDMLIGRMIARSPGFPEMAAASIYAGALGAPNLSPALFNTLQAMTTTIHRAGVRNTLLGFRDAFKSVSKYLRSRFVEGMSKEEALRIAFPGLYSTGLMGEGPGVLHALVNPLEAAGPLGRTGWEKVQSGLKMLMMPFGISEKFSWLVTYNAAKRMVMQAAGGDPRKIMGDTIRVVARSMIAETQFLSGPMYTPVALLESPSLRNPLLRQFAQFPLRLAGLTARSLFGQEAGVPWWQKLGGTAGRMMVGTQLVQGLGRVAGVDLERATLMEGLPLPTTGMPFAPFPVAPPALSVLAGIPLALAGKPEPLQYSWPTLIPGGLGASKILSALSPGAAKVFGRVHIDLQHPSEDGRYVVYSKEGRPLYKVGNWQALLTTLGFRTNTYVEELNATQAVLKTREVATRTIQRMVDALATNNAEEWRRANDDWQSLFPGAPVPLTKAHIDGVLKRRAMSRLSILSMSLPPSIRQQVVGVLSTNPNLLLEPVMEGYRMEDIRGSWLPIGRSITVEDSGEYGSPWEDFLTVE